MIWHHENTSQAVGTGSGGLNKEGVSEKEMDVKEAVKDKAQYKDIIAYFQGMDRIGTEQLVLLIDTIGLMSEEIFEHYKALQVIFKKAVSEILRRRNQEGNFDFLTDSQKCQLSYAIEKAGNLRVLLSEKYEEYDKELLATQESCRKKF